MNRSLCRALAAVSLTAALLAAGCSDDKDKGDDTPDGALDGDGGVSDAAEPEDDGATDPRTSPDGSVTHDAGGDSGTGMDAGSDAGNGGGMDAGSDGGGMDAGSDASDVDSATSSDAASDAGTDAGDAAADASASDAGSDATADSAAGDTGVGTTFCPGEPTGCSLATEVCCLSSGCASKATGCPDGGASIGCDGREDCSGATPVCCASQAGLTCAASCSGFTACNDNGDCEGNDTCLGLGGGDVGFCFPAPGGGGACTPACPSGQRCVFGNCLPSFDGGFNFPFEGGLGN